MEKTKIGKVYQQKDGLLQLKFDFKNMDLTLYAGDKLEFKEIENPLSPNEIYDVFIETLSVEEYITEMLGG